MIRAARTAALAHGRRGTVEYACIEGINDRPEHAEELADLLAPLGYAPAQDAEDADMVILNTCHIREKAAEKVYSDLGRLRTIKTPREVTILREIGRISAEAMRRDSSE